MINWQYYPRSTACPNNLLKIISIFETINDQIDSYTHEGQVSNDVLAQVRPGLVAEGFEVESGKKKVNKVHVPVFFGPNGKPQQSFEADAWHREDRIVLEVEAGRAVTNYQFLKDLFQACMMQDVEYLSIAVRNIYRNSSKDWEKVCTFFETMYASNRLELPLKGVLIIGY
jgi:hypothetical protein